MPNNNVCQRLIDFPNMNDGDKFGHLIRNKWRETTNFIDKAWCIRTQKLYKNFVTQNTRGSF